MAKKLTMPDSGTGLAFALPDYTMRDRSEVESFLRQNPYLGPLLSEAHQRLQQYFPGAPLFLEVAVDPEEDFEELLLTVFTSLPPGEARAIRNRFDDDWWLASLNRAKGNLCIALGYRR